MTFKTEINTIINALISVSEKFTSYDAARKNAVLNLRGKMLEDEMATLERDLKGATKFYVTSMTAAVDHMIEEAKAGNHYDINDPAVANAAALLANNGMPFDAAEAIIKGFTGNITALEIIKSASAEEYKGLFDYWTFDNVAALEKLNSTINTLNYENGQNFPGIVSTIREKVEEFARRQGVDIGTSSEKLEEMRVRNITNLMGLDYDKIHNN